MRPFQCERCKQRFGTQKGLSQHEWLCYPIGQRPIRSKWVARHVRTKMSHAANMRDEL
jgi:hypothetical protein